MGGIVLIAKIFLELLLNIHWTCFILDMRQYEYLISLCHLITVSLPNLSLGNSDFR